MLTGRRPNLYRQNLAPRSTIKPVQRLKGVRMGTFARVVLWVVSAVTGVVGGLFLAYVLLGRGSLWPGVVALAVALPLVAIVSGYIAYSLGGGATRPCPRCGKGVQRGLVVCATCGFDFNVLVPGAQTDATETSPPPPPVS
jgi:hypothetical protein